MEKVLSSTVKVRFQDCDPFNHLNNSKYIDYFINAREDQILEHYSIDVVEYLKTTGRSWVVASNQIMYLRPAFTHETVIIESELQAFSETSILVEMKMWNAAKSELKAIFWIRFAHFDLQTKKKAMHPENLMELFKDVVIRQEEVTFEHRCSQIVEERRRLDAS